MATQVDANDVEGRLQSPHERSAFEQRTPRGAVKEQEGRTTAIAAFVNCQLAVAMRDGLRHPTRCRGFAKLDEDAVRLFWMHEKDMLVVGPGLGRLAEQCKAGVPKALHRILGVVHLKGEMVQAFAPAVNKFLHWGIVGQGLQEFQFSGPGTEEVGAHLLFGDGFGLVGTCPKKILKAANDRVDVVDCDADVFESGHVVGASIEESGTKCECY